MKLTYVTMFPENYDGFLETVQINTGDVDLFPAYKIYGKRINQHEELLQSFSLDLPEEITYQQVLVNFTLNSKKAYNSFRIESCGVRGREDTRFVIYQLDIYGSFFIHDDMYIQTCHNYPQIRFRIYMLFAALINS